MTCILCGLNQWQFKFLTILWVDWVQLNSFPVPHCEMCLLLWLHSVGRSVGPAVINMASRFPGSLSTWAPSFSGLAKCSAPLDSFQEQRWKPIGLLKLESSPGTVSLSTESIGKSKSQGHPDSRGGK